MRQSVELDPLSVHYQFCLGSVYFNARRWDDALRETERAKEIDSTFGTLDYQYAEIYFYKGMYDRAVEHARRLVSHETQFGPYVEYMMARIDAVAGRTDDARRRIRRLEEGAKDQKFDPAGIASLYALLGDTDTAMKWLQTAYRDHSFWFLTLKVWPAFDPLRGDPRFKELARQAGFDEKGL
jgi:tetratricopeptide (TPR) repeat protein